MQWPPLLHPFDEKEQRLANSFTLLWTNFAKYGTPNHGLGPDQAVWPPFTTDGDQHMYMRVPTVPGVNLAKPQ